MIDIASEKCNASQAITAQVCVMKYVLKWITEQSATSTWPRSTRLGSHRIAEDEVAASSG